MSSWADLKSHAHSVPSGNNTIVDAVQAAELIKTAAAANTNVTLAAKHPKSDSSSAAFVGLAVLQAGGDFVRFEYQPRPIGDEDVEIQITHSGICGSDLHTMDSGWGKANYPVIVGHEIVGNVTAVGAKVARLHVGDVVGVGAEVLSCRACDDCKHHNDAYCTKATYTYNSTYADGQFAFGGYQKKVRVHNEWAFIIPKEISPAEAPPLLCAGVTVFAPLKRHVKAGDNVGVVGIGGLGHLGVQFAHKLGAHVTAISTSLRKKDDALKLGAKSFLVSTDAAAMTASNRSFDVILLTANPDNAVLDPILRLLKVGGRVIVVGAPETPISFGIMALIGNRSNITGSLIGSKHEVQEALDFAAKHGVRPIVEKIPITKAHEGIKKMRNNDVKYRVVLEVSEF